MIPAAAPVAIQRPTYREGGLLEVAELRTEQQSRGEALARHARGVHTPGVAIGLRMTVATVPGVVGVEIQPGLAVDGAGRYLGLETPLTVALADGDTVTVSITWRAGTSQIELSAAAPPPQADRTEDAWPVVLGRAERSAGTVTVHTGSREELELRATTLTPPPGGSRVVLGARSGQSTQVFGVQLAGDAGGFGDVTTVDSDGTASIGTDTGVRGEVTGATRVVLSTPVPAPPAALPWSLYRALTGEDKTAVEQLRLELGEVRTGDDPHARELVVAHGGSGPGPDLLHVDAGGTVTIQGNLVVEGFTTFTGYPSPLPGATTLGDLAAQTASLLARAQVLLNSLTDTDLLASQTGLPIPVVGTSLTYTLTLTSTGTAVRAVAAYETVVVGSSPPRQGFVAQGVDLAAGAASSIPRSIGLPGALPAGTPIDITVLAVGVGQDGQPRTGTLHMQTHT